MKKLLKSIAISTLVITICLGFYAFKKYQQIKTAADVFRDIMYNAIYTSGEEDYAWPDSALTVKRPRSYDTTQIETRGPSSMCYNSTAYFYSDLATSIGVNDVMTFGYNKNALLNFKQAFGKDLLGPKVLLAAKDYDKKPTYMLQFKADALQAAFEKLYKKPTDDFDGFAMQRIYNIGARDYFRNCAQVIADVMKRKSMFISLSLDYKKQALTKKDFYGPDAGYSAFEKLLGENYAPRQGLEGCMEGTADRVVGILIRRQLDGTLPTLLVCAKTVLQDYDPVFYEKIKNQF